MARVREFLIEEKTRHGKLRYLFHRRPDGRRMTIKGKPGEDEFERRYEWLVNGGDTQIDLERESIARQKAGSAPVTVAELGRYYRAFVDKEQERRALSEHTVQHYSRFTERFFRDFGLASLDEISTHHLERILDGWSNTDNAWNNALRAVKHLFSYASSHWGLKPNPAAELEKRKITTSGFRPWEPEEIEQYFQTHKLGSKAHLAMLLFLELAPRRADIVKLGPSNVFMIDGQKHIIFVPQKTKNKSNTKVTFPMSERLIEAIEAAPTGEETFLITDFGKPFTAAGFGNKLAEWRDEAGVRSCVASHGLRKSVGINMAENDATPYEIMAALGHSSPKVTQVYTEEADRRKLSTKAAAKSSLSKFAEQPLIKVKGEL